MKLELVIASDRSERTFQATCLAYVEANELWSGGLTRGDVKRPAWALFAGTEQELRPFVANLKLGRKAKDHRDQYEFLKSADYQYLWQREEEGAFVTVVLPELFRADPGMVDPDGIAFVLLPSEQWLREQQVDRVKTVEHALRIFAGIEREKVEELVPLAALFAVYLDRRTRCPIVADPRFHLQLLIACMLERFVVKPGDGYYGHSPLGYRQRGVAEVGLHPGLAMRVGHEHFERVLADQTRLFFEAV